jgi:hypothetical protein
MKSGNHRRGVRVPFWNRVSKLEFVHGIALTFVSRRLAQVARIQRVGFTNRSALLENDLLLKRVASGTSNPKGGDLSRPWKERMNHGDTGTNEVGRIQTGRAGGNHGERH